MRINHNIAALNALNRSKINNENVASNFQRISSGLRINSASDDAAGLSISEKMKALIRGLGQAQNNIEDGKSLVSVAESATINSQTIDFDGSKWCTDISQGSGILSNLPNGGMIENGMTAMQLVADDYDFRESVSSSSKHIRLCFA